MAYNGRVDNQWRSPTRPGDDGNESYLGELSNQAPQHPITTMQGAFEESMLETMTEDDFEPVLSRKDSVYRRKMLLERPQYERTVAGKWKQKPGEKFHPLWKIVAQLSFGMHLLHQGLAKSDEEVLKILQGHVDEVDGFLERTTEDFDLAQHDITERVRYLNLPLEHGNVFDSMLSDRGFRTAMVEGNVKIEHIIDRTTVALIDSLKDVKKGFDGTRELSRYLRKLERTWQARNEEHADVFHAMLGNTEGWSGAFIILQDKGKKLTESLEHLRGIIAEIQRLVGIASRRDAPKVFKPQTNFGNFESRSAAPPATAPLSRARDYGEDEQGHEAVRYGKPANRSKYTDQATNTESQARRASFGDRTRNLAKRLSLNGSSDNKYSNGSKGYPQTAVAPKSGPWGADADEDDSEISDRQRKTQSMVSPHSPYDLDYLLRVTPSDTTISPMRDSELAGLRSGGRSIVSPLGEMLSMRSAPMQAHSYNKIDTILENTSEEGSNSDPFEDEEVDQVHPLLRDIEATKQQFSEAAAVRPLKPKTPDLPLRDFKPEEQKKPNIRASSIYSRHPDLNSVYSPPEPPPVPQIPAIIRTETGYTSNYGSEPSSSSAYTDITFGTISPPPAVSSAKPSPLHFRDKHEVQDPLGIRTVPSDIEAETRKPPSPKAVEETTALPKSAAPPIPTEPKPLLNPPSPTLATLTSATMSGPEPEFPFFSATVNGPEPDFPYPTPTETPNEHGSKHPELYQRIAAATGAEPSSTSPPRPSIADKSASPSRAPAGSPQSRKRDHPPSLNLKLFPPPDQYTRAASVSSPRSPRQIDPLDTAGAGPAIQRTLTPLGGLGPGPAMVSNTSLVPPRMPDDIPSMASMAGGKPAKSPWRKVFSPGVLTTKLKEKGHRRGKSSGDQGGGSRNGSNGRITPLPMEPPLTAGGTQLVAGNSFRNESISDQGGRKASAAAPRIVGGMGGDGTPF